MRVFSKIYLLPVVVLCIACDSGDGGGLEDSDSSDTDTITDTGTDSGSDTTKGLNDCEIMELATFNAVTEFCADLTDTCCYCQCYGMNQGFNGTLYFESDKCECVSTEVIKCEDTYLETAQQCVKDLDSCIDNFVSVAASGCNMTPLN